MCFNLMIPIQFDAIQPHCIINWPTKSFKFGLFFFSFELSQLTKIYAGIMNVNYLIRLLSNRFDILMSIIQAIDSITIKQTNALTRTPRQITTVVNVVNMFDSTFLVRISELRCSLRNHIGMGLD